MPPVGSPAGAGFFSGLSATTASVVRNRPAIDACVEQRGAGDLHRVVDAGSEHVDVLAGRGVEAVSDGQVAHLVGDNTRLEAGVERDLLERSVDGDAHDVRAGRLVARRGSMACLERGLAGLDEGNATTGDDALFDGSLRVADGVLDAVLALLELDLGRGSGLDDGNATGELGEALLQLLAVVVAVGVLDLACGSARRGRRSASASPAPSTMVVSSLVMTTLRARPSRSRVAFSSLRPTSSEMTWPPVRIAMSCSCALRRSPKPGALTATDLKMPRILFTTRVARASPSTSSAMMRSCLPVWITLSTIGSRSLMFEILELTIRM